MKRLSLLLALFLTACVHGDPAAPEPCELTFYYHTESTGPGTLVVVPDSVVSTKGCA